MKLRKISLLMVMFLVIGCGTGDMSGSNIIVNSNVVVSTENPINSVGNVDLGDYYDGLNTSLSGNDFLKNLDSLLDSTSAPSDKFSYNGSNNGMQTIFPYTDADPANPTSNKIISFYSGKPSTWSGMNREHVWPKSRGGNATEKDPHVIRPTISSENSDRGNDFYNEGSNWDPASFNNPKYRGIAARIVFYAAVRYQESGLKLVDLNTDSQTNKSMGKLSSLLKWNLQYPIDATETLRNEVLVDKYNHCRNPFIDHPEFACKIWGNTNQTTKSICNM